MKALPLYPSQPKSILDRVSPRNLSPACTSCALSDQATRRCLAPDGEPGGLYVIGVAPMAQEERYGSHGRPWSAASNVAIRRLIASSPRWKNEAVVFDNAVRCAPGATKITPKMAAACRPHTARVLFDTSPKRILCFGLEASESVLGRRVSGVFARRGHGWHFDEEGDPVPVFFLPTPQSVLGNKIQTARLEEDVRWALEYEPAPPAYTGTTYLIESLEDSEQACAALSEAESIVYDVETHGKPFNRDFSIVALTILGAEDQASYTWGRDALRDPDTVKTLQKLLEDPSIGKIGQNVKYDDLAAACALDAIVPSTEVDTRLWRKLEDSFAQADLETLAELVGMGGHKEEARDALSRVVAELNRQAAPEPGPTKTGKARKKRAAIVDIDVPEETLDRIRGGVEPESYAYAYLPEDALLRYNARDVWTTRRAAAKLTDEAPKHVARMWNEITRDASVAIRHIEGWGFACDAEATRAFSGYCRLRLMESRGVIEKYAGSDFNPASPKQLEAFLFDKLGLRSPKTTTSGARSTDASVLEMLSKKHPIVDAILEFRRFEKLDGTYARGMLPHIRDDGRIHPSYLIDGTDTGRLSCRDPNLQNLPRAKGSEDAKYARNCFVAAPGHVLLELDFSQIELRVAAYLSKDRNMIADFKRGIDIHANNARACAPLVWKITHAQWDAMTKDQRDPYRSKIKTATFGRLYGKPPRTLAREWGVDVKEVEQVDRVIWGRYSDLEAWTHDCVRESRKTGVAWTWWKGEHGLCRPIPLIASADEGTRAHAERTSYNTPVQGTAAHYTNASLWPIVKWILKYNVPAKVVGTVHDSIMLEVREAELGRVAAKAHEVMTSHYLGDVPILVDAKTGPAWGELADYKIAA